MKGVTTFAFTQRQTETAWEAVKPCFKGSVPDFEAYEKAVKSLIQSGEVSCNSNFRKKAQRDGLQALVLSALPIVRNWPTYRFGVKIFSWRGLFENCQEKQRSDRQMQEGIG